MDNTLQQPDFFDAARGLRAAADNLELCQNIPGVKDGQRYIQTLERLMTHLNEIQEEQRRGFSRSQSALESLQRDLQREIGAKYESLQREIGAKYEEIGAKYESLQRENSAKYESLLREIGIRDRNRLIAMENSVIVDRNSQMEPF
ncbi:hypothetical protein ED733_000049 [Metarhizium rileyi]|uniref:Uncharacterized protein n=1 Tax=Metarhizium rileyi (strain RCEF 4871) TaxID=1649241 RepID=A0A5C6FY82_METRR|nr:hypothetical protein ED733_000049 [Metarhizium rileyi]